jgi:hypothetical protein
MIKITISPGDFLSNIKPYFGKFSLVTYLATLQYLKPVVKKLGFVVWKGAGPVNFESNGLSQGRRHGQRNQHTGPEIDNLLDL